jgi:hypothetical protein
VGWRGTEIVHVRTQNDLVLMLLHPLIGMRSLGLNQSPGEPQTPIVTPAIRMIIKIHASQNFRDLAGNPVVQYLYPAIKYVMRTIIPNILAHDGKMKESPHLYEVVNSKEYNSPLTLIPASPQLGLPALDKKVIKTTFFAEVKRGLDQ